MQSQRINLPNKKEVIKFFDSISKINESCILTLDSEKGELTSLVSSPDNTLIFYSILSNIESTRSATLNIPDIKKLTRVLESVQSDDIEINLNSNNLEYAGKGLKFKYHLFEDGFLTKPSISIEKIKSFESDIKFTLKKDTLNNLIKSSAFTTDSNKIYFYTESGSLKAELTDRARHNIDTIVVDLGEVEFTLSPVAINLDNIKLITSLTDSIEFGINTNYGVVVIDIVAEHTKLKYIITSLSS